MFMKRIAIFCWTLLVSGITNGKTIDSVAAISQLTDAIKQYHIYTIDYNIDVVFPNGDKDYMNGTIVMDESNGLYSNHCRQNTVAYSKQWFYRADHLEKNIVIVDMGKLDKKTRAQRHQEIFRAGAISAFADTVLLKYGKIKSLKYEGTTCTIAITLPARYLLEKIEYSFDTGTKKISWCRSESFQPIDESGKNKVRITTEYTRISDNTDSIIAIDTLFSHTKRKIVLKKHQDYKLVGKL
jgi:hypothetical protein